MLPQHVPNRAPSDAVRGFSVLKLSMLVPATISAVAAVALMWLDPDQS